jgi:glutathione S-transferase
MRSMLSLVFVATLIFAVGGCTTPQAARARPLSVAIAITPVGTGTVSAAQAAEIQRALRPELEGAGYVLADRPTAADLVLTVSFVPAPGGPGGRIRLTGLEPTDQFRRATEGSDTLEAKEFRRLERELQSIVEARGKNIE